MKKQWYVNFWLVFSLCYFGIAIAGKVFLNRELFPFYHWSLYSLVPQNAERVKLYLVSVQGKEVPYDNLLKKSNLLGASPIEVNTVLQRYYNCYSTNCSNLKKEEKKLSELLPINCEIHIVHEKKEGKQVIAKIINRKMSYE